MWGGKWGLDDLQLWIVALWINTEVLGELQNMGQESYKEATWWCCWLENVQQVPRCSSPLRKTIILLMQYETYCTLSFKETWIHLKKKKHSKINVDFSEKVEQKFVHQYRNILVSVFLVSVLRLSHAYLKV